MRQRYILRQPRTSRCEFDIDHIVAGELDFRERFSRGSELVDVFLVGDIFGLGAGEGVLSLDVFGDDELIQFRDFLIKSWEELAVVVVGETCWGYEDLRRCNVLNLMIMCLWFPHQTYR